MSFGIFAPWSLLKTIPDTCVFYLYFVQFGAYKLVLYNILIIDWGSLLTNVLLPWRCTVTTSLCVGGTCNGGIFQSSFSVRQVLWSAINLAQPAAVTVNTHVPWCFYCFHSHPILWHQTCEHFQKTEISSNSLNKYINWYCYQFHYNKTDIFTYLLTYYGIQIHRPVWKYVFSITSFSFPFISAPACLLNRRICFCFLWN